VDRVLVVDDDPRIRSFVGRALTGSGYTVTDAADGSTAFTKATRYRPDLVLLDLVMPGQGGMSLLGDLLRFDPTLNIIVLSALDDVPSKVRCLGLGAVDYLAKPFSVAELLARVQVRLRDSGAVASRRVRVGSGTVDLDRRIAWREGRSTRLTEGEFVLLQHLLKAGGAVCTREEIHSEVWGMCYDPGSNLLEVCVGRLRAKLGREAIETVRNVGYRLAA
jgi:DNA-binding response OmpR family regulator